jgi:hypothetical protein
MSGLEQVLLRSGPPADLDVVALGPEVRRILRPLRPYRVLGLDKARFGDPNDGGYVCFDDFRGVDTALSLGIDHNVSWDIHVADRGLTIHQFDHTVKAPRPTDRRMMFTRKRIAVHASPETESLESIVVQHDKRLERPNIILKMDIENDEWAVFDAVSLEALSGFSQIICEMHAFEFLVYTEWRHRAARVIRKLTDNYAVVHVHANNNAATTNHGNVYVPNVIEMTFVNKRAYSLIEENDLFPGALDAPCNPGAPDIFLGCFRF